MTDEPQTAVGEADLRERIDSIIIFARDSLDNGFLTGGDVGNMFGIRDNAVALGQDLRRLLSSVSERERGLVEALTAYVEWDFATHGGEAASERILSGRAAIERAAT